MFRDTRDPRSRDEESLVRTRLVWSGETRNQVRPSSSDEPQRFIGRADSRTPCLNHPLPSLSQQIRKGDGPFSLRPPVFRRKRSEGPIKSTTLQSIQLIEYFDLFIGKRIIGISHNLSQGVFLYMIRIGDHGRSLWNTPLSQKRLH